MLLIAKKQIFSAAIFNINYLDFSWNAIECDFLILHFQCSVFSVIKRPTIVTKTSETIIDHILTNSFID